MENFSARFVYKRVATQCALCETPPSPPRDAAPGPAAPQAPRGAGSGQRRHPPAPSSAAPPRGTARPGTPPPPPPAAPGGRCGTAGGPRASGGARRRLRLLSEAGRRPPAAPGPQRGRGSCPSGSASRAAPGALVPRWAPARGVRSGRRWAVREGPRSARLGGSRGASASPGLLPGAEALRGDGGGAGQRSACSLLRGRPRGLPSEPHIRLQKSSKFCSRWHKARTSSGAAEQAFL